MDEEDWQVHVKRGNGVDPRGRKQAILDATLLVACRLRKLHWVLQLIEAGARITATMSPGNCRGVLHQAVCVDQVLDRDLLDAPTLVEKLIELGAPVNQRDVMGCTPLYFATVNQLNGSAEVLTRHSADPLPSNNDELATPFSIGPASNPELVPRMVEVFFSNGQGHVQDLSMVPSTEIRPAP